MVLIIIFFVIMCSQKKEYPVNGLNKVHLKKIILTAPFCANGYKNGLKIFFVIIINCWAPAVWQKPCIIIFKFADIVWISKLCRQVLPHDKEIPLFVCKITRLVFIKIRGEASLQLKQKSMPSHLEGARFNLAFTIFLSIIPCWTLRLSIYEWVLTQMVNLLRDSRCC